MWYLCLLNPRERLTVMHVQLFWVIGPTALLIVTAAAMAGLFAVDFVPVPQSTDLRSLQQAQSCS